jgi:hypothetical protein
MKFDSAKDLEFYAKYAHTLLQNGLPDEVTFVIICAVRNQPIYVKGNTDAQIVKDLLELAWHSVSEYINSTGDQPATTEQRQ